MQKIFENWRQYISEQSSQVLPGTGAEATSGIEDKLQTTLDDAPTSAASKSKPDKKKVKIRPVVSVVDSITVDSDYFADIMMKYSGKKELGRDHFKAMYPKLSNTERLQFKAALRDLLRKTGNAGIDPDAITFSPN